MKRTLAALAALAASTFSPFLAAQPANPQPDEAPSPDPDEAPSPDPDAAPQPYVPNPDIIIDDAALEAVTQTEGDELTRDVVAEALAPAPGGLSTSEVAKLAVADSTDVALAQAELRAASARVDQAVAAFFPTLTLGANYSRLSPVRNQFDTGDLPLPPGAADAFTFPVIVNQWSLTATLDVPISDYLLRLSQGYAAAENDLRSRELVIAAEKLRVAANAKMLYFNWVRARGQAVVAQIGFALSERHLEDAKITLAAGLITEADVARLEAQLAQSEYLQQQTSALARVADTQLKLALGIPADRKLAIGVDVMADPPPFNLTDLEQLKRKALANRLDYQALEAQEESLESVVDATRAGHYPRLNAFASGLYANPNPRVFPQQEKWDFTWEVGVRLTWTVNDTFSTIGAAREREAAVDATRVQKEALAEAIELEVAQAFFDAQVAGGAIAAAEQRERAARMSLGIRRLQFRAGNATATDIVDAEAELIRAQLQRIDAHVDYLVAMARLEYAVGEPI